MEPATHWWLDEGGESCPRCLQTYAYEVEVRCVECDGPLCPHCAVRVTELVVRCPDCPAGDA
jgi:hypothetical protein